MTDSLDLTDYASCLIHPIMRNLDQCPELRTTAMDTLSALVTQLGKKYHVFIPMVDKVLKRHNIKHQRYDILMCRIIKVWLLCTSLARVEGILELCEFTVDYVLN